MSTYTRPASALATEPQKKFVRDLLAERVSDDFGTIDFDTLSSYRAHNLIDTLLARPKVATTAPAQAPVASPAVPEGYYALHIARDAQKTSFFKVSAPTEGRWAGRVFLAQLASDNEWPVKGARRGMVMAEIAKDYHAAGARFGRRIGRCCRCHRTLTDDKSRANGIGPECAGKF